MAAALFIGPGALAAAARHHAAHRVVVGDAACDHPAFPQLGTRLPGFQRFELEVGGTLTWCVGPVLDALRGLSAAIDAFHLFADDAAFSDAALYRQLARLAKPGAVLHVERTALNWTLAGAAEFVRHEQGATARYRGGPHRRARHPYQGERHAIVIGAGLAGSAAASRLARRGWRITVLDRGRHPGSGASGNLAAVMSPMLSRDDNRTSRLSRASFLYLQQELRTLDQSALHWSASGVMQLAKDDNDEALMRDILARRDYPAAYCQSLSQEEVSKRFGLPAPAGGLYFQQGGWVNPPSLCAGRLAACPEIETRFGVNVDALTRHDGHWTVHSEGKAVACAPLVILANSHDAARLPQAAALRFKPVRGQVSHLPADALPPLDCVWQRDGYLTPAIDGLRCLGATYDFDNTNPNPDAAGHAQNLKRIPQMLPGVTPSLDPANLQGRVGFRALTIDRLPLVGPLPDPAAIAAATTPQLFEIPRFDGLYGLLGLGSRGLVWSALAGETLASMIEAEPLPIEQDLAEAIDPARFLVRQRREAESSHAPGAKITPPCR